MSDLLDGLVVLAFIFVLVAWVLLEVLSGPVRKERR